MNDLQLDSPNFDPRKYISNFLKGNTIKDLIKKNNEIQEQIKIHDHQIQSLVFQNYSKFISSIDTVKQMKNDISKVDDKLKNLDQSMQKISELATKIDSTFSVKRKQIQKLDTINKDLKKLKNLCEFPEILKSDLQFYKSLQKSQDKLPYLVLFESSIQYYKECFLTLNEFKTEPLIAPIYKQSINKVQQIRSILWNLQNLLKSRNNSKQLKNITKKLLTVTEEQSSPLRNYFKKAKEKFTQNSLSNQKYFNSIQMEFKDDQQQISELRNKNDFIIKKTNEQKKIFINQFYWKQFQEDFRYIYEEIKPIVKNSEEIETLIQNSLKQIFVFVINNFQDSVQRNCNSTLHLTFLLESVNIYFKNILKLVTHQNLKKQFSQLMKEKFELICTNHVYTIFMKLKIGTIQRLIKQKSQILSVKISQDTQKEIYVHLNPLKTWISSNLIRILTGIYNIKDKEYFKDRKSFNLLIFNQIIDYIKLVCFTVSTSSNKMSEQIYGMIHNQYSKLLSTQKKVIEDLIIKFKNTEQIGVTFAFNHNILSIINKTLMKKLIDDYYQISNNNDQEWKFQIEKQNNTILANVCKRSIVKNLHNFSLYYINLIEKIYSNKIQEEKQQLEFSLAIKYIEEYLELTGLIFPENRRNIPKKPSFLNTTERTYSYDTEIMQAKKIHIFEKKDILTRNLILSSFIKGILKIFLRKVRTKNYRSSRFEYEVYCLVQLCFEISNVDEESVIYAFYYLIREEYYEKQTTKIDKTILDNVFSTQRNKIKI